MKDWDYSKQTILVGSYQGKLGSIKTYSGRLKNTFAISSSGIEYIIQIKPESKASQTLLSLPIGKNIKIIYLGSHRANAETFQVLLSP